MMKYKLELAEFSLYENEEMEQLLHERALQGYLVFEISNHFILYKKSEPQELYFQIDYFDKKHLINGIDSKQVDEYADFLSTYHCERVCGYGYRQIIRLPHKDFVLYEHEQKVTLKRKCIEKDRRFYLLAEGLVLTILLIGFFTNDVTDTLFSQRLYRFLPIVIFTTLSALPYLLKQSKNNRNYRKALFAIFALYVVGLIVYHVVMNKQVVVFTISMALLVVFISIMNFIEKKKWLSKQSFDIIIYLFAVVFGLIIYNIIFY
ncbi:MAG: DUF2812 domain-containing protein [Erysipelotrichia bacterium]|nr:DUF2812 domain-containing protein [Erysipelotrichia bacterium]NCC54035.1 DUF2812 domain-containing protein [Erysipelotrichia bacterium]